jgi:hypothetical protein
LKLIIVLLCAGSGMFAGFGFPAGGLEADEVGCAAPLGVVLETDLQSPELCRLAVVSDADTRLDRGSLRSLAPMTQVVGSFRLLQETQGRVLYVYDDTQSLLCRVTNPASVTLLDVVQ